MDFRTIDLTWVTSAAVLGFVGSLTVALVNAFAARRLERAKSLREYRSTLAKPCRDYAMSTGALVGRYGMIVMTNEWDELGAQPSEWVLSLHNLSIQNGSVNSPAPVVTRAFKNSIRAQKVLATEVTIQTAHPDPSARDNYIEFSNLLLNAYGSIEDAIEVFVYGGLRARLKLWLRLRRIEKRLTEAELAQAPRFAKLTTKP